MSTRLRLVMNHWPRTGNSRQHPGPATRPVGAVLALLLLLSLLATCPAGHPAWAGTTATQQAADGQAIDLGQKKYRQLFAELEKKHHFSPNELQAIFAGLTISRRVLELMDRQWEAKPYYQYAPLFLTPQNITKGREKLRRYRRLLDRIEQRFGVDREVVIAIWGIETRYGAHQGGFNVLQTLNTLFDAYPRRSKFFRKQLVHFLILCRENQIDPRSVMGSYAGAFGQTQFIPSSFRTYAVSFDGDSRRDVWNSVPDVLASIANYLKQFGWTLDGPIYADIGHELRDRRLLAAQLRGRKGRVPVALVRRAQGVEIPPSPGNRPVAIVALELAPGGPYPVRYIAAYPNFQAITEWNHSNRYAMAVTELAQALTTPAASAPGHRP